MNFEKLKNIKAKFDELTEQLAKPEIIADNKEWTRIVKEHSELRPVAEAYDRLNKISAELCGGEEMLADALLAEVAGAVIE